MKARFQIFKAPFYFVGWLVSGGSCFTYLWRIACVPYVPVRPACPVRPVCCVANATNRSPADYLTIHSNNPAALSSGSTTSRRKALVLTGSKFTVQAAPFSVG